MSKQTHQHTKELNEKLAISIDGHKHRIKEQRTAIKDAKRSIKMHKLLIKQSKITTKLQLLEVE